MDEQWIVWNDHYYHRNSSVIVLHSAMLRWINIPYSCPISWGNHTWTEIFIVHIKSPKCTVYNCLNLRKKEEKTHHYLNFMVWWFLMFFIFFDMVIYLQILWIPLHPIFIIIFFFCPHSKCLWHWTIYSPNFMFYPELALSLAPNY